MQGELTILGCGDSAGTPRIGNAWGKCDPGEPKNRRTRPAISVQTGVTTLIVDTGPDFKNQVNRENITSIDAVLYTHAHADHVNGMDDLRPWYDRHKKRIPIFMHQETFDDLNHRFNYIFKQKSPIYPSIVETTIWTEEHFSVQQDIGDIPFTPFLQDHGFSKTLGFRFGNVAYSTDLIDLDARALQTLKGIDTWIVDGANLYIDNAIIHFNLKRIQEFNEIIGAETVYLTHMKYDLDYQSLLDNLPRGILPAYDGLKMPVAF